ncbi:uncharacterized protein TNCV_778961 [Trichonephila clavipes]|nr:uncharacterized protein TNCV_778961 [Trichonephila clavipes]
MNFLQTIIENRKHPTPCFIMNSDSHIIELSNPVSHRYITCYIFTINLYKLTINFNWLNIPCVQKMEYKKHFTVGGIGSRLKQFERPLTRMKTTQSSYKSVTGLTINQRLVCTNFELQNYHSGCVKTK